jgi:hypothetical protein
MIARKLSQVFGDELSSASNLMTSGAAGLSEEKVPAAGWVCWHGGRSRIAVGVALRRAFGGPLQEAQISNYRMAIFLSHVAECGHSALRNSVVNQVEQALI